MLTPSPKMSPSSRMMSPTFEALAEPGGICLSAAAHEQVRDRLDITFVDLGEQQLKNITRPVRTYGVALRISSRAALPVGAPLPLQISTIS